MGAMPGNPNQTAEPEAPSVRAGRFTKVPSCQECRKEHADYRRSRKVSVKMQQTILSPNDTVVHKYREDAMKPNS